MEKEISILELSKLIKEIVEYKGNIIFDKDKPDGTPRKLMDISIISKLGWFPKLSLKDGLKITYLDFCTKYVR